MRRKKLDEPEVQSITSAPAPGSEDLAHRQKVYLVQMVVRVLSFLVAVVTWGRIPLWLSLVLVVGAVVLPYTAVLFANAPTVRRGSATAVGRHAVGGGPVPHKLPGGTP